MWTFRVEAWVDRVASYQDELRRKVEAGQDDLAGELSEGAALLGRETLTVEEALAAPAGDRHAAASSPNYRVDVDRELARFGAWYELFPRSWGGFEGVRRLLPRFAELGFDVLYLPPVHPIGRTNRKGRNNALAAEAGRPGQPVGDRRRTRAATRRSTRSSAPSPTSSASSPRRGSTGSRSRSTSPSSARPTIRG